MAPGRSAILGWSGRASGQARRTSGGDRRCERTAVGLTAAVVLACLVLGLGAARAAEFPTFKAQEIDPHVGNVCYAVTTADVDGDGKLDAVAVAEDAVYWYANPSWEKHTLIKDATERDNVCIQPHDIDGDGKVDFALGASLAADEHEDRRHGPVAPARRRRRRSPGRSSRSASEPTVHRMRWGDVTGSGKKQLVVAPLQGRGTKGPNWGEGKGVRVLVYTVPADPAKDAWTSRSPTTRCTRPTTSSSSTSTATAATRS